MDFFSSSPTSLANFVFCTMSSSKGPLIAQQEKLGIISYLLIGLTVLDYQIKPQANTPPADTSAWPLLLKVCVPRCDCSNSVEL
jgi:hypothetical protein